VLLALDDLNAEVLEGQLERTLKGPIANATSRAVDIIERRDNLAWCPAIHGLFRRLDPSRELIEASLWYRCLRFLLRHDYLAKEMKAALPRAEGIAIGEAALLALENDPDRSLPLFRRALRSHIPANRSFEAATRHGGDPAASLAALSSVGSVADDLRKEVADPDVLGSIANIPTDSQLDPYATRATLPPDSPSAAVRFRKLREHASGNLGVVYIARDEELNREVALKEIKVKNADHLHSQAKFLLEAEVTGSLEHPGIVPVYGLGHHNDGRPFYAMRFIRGKSLLDAIKRFHADDSLKADPGARLLALQKLLRRFTDVCNAIAYAHSRGVLHRDLKPANVMVGKYGETLVVDWGLAKALGRSGGAPGTVADHDDPLPEVSLHPSTSDHLEATQAGSLVGTPAYMSPEQAGGRLDLLGPASDIYGLGATLYHLITGRPPLSGTTFGEVLSKIQAGEIPRPRAIAPWLDKALEAICLKAMALKPEDRYATPRALADDLDLWIAGEPVAAYPEPFIRRVKRWSRKHSLFSLLVLVCLPSLIEYAFLRSQRKPDWFSTYHLPELARAKENGFVASLEEARIQGANINSSYIDTTAKDKAYLEIFSNYGIDLAALPAELAAERIRSSKIANDLRSAVDDWAASQQSSVTDTRLRAIARATEIDPERVAIRDQIERRDATSLRRLCETWENGRDLDARFRLVFEGLLRLDTAGNLPLLETILRKHPSDFWLNHELGMAYLNVSPPKTTDAVRCLSIAVALRPDSPGAHTNLGQALEREGKLDQAVVEYREAKRIGSRAGVALRRERGRVYDATTP
jgi:serine/threonine protein kinase